MSSGLFEQFQGPDRGVDELFRSVGSSLREQRENRGEDVMDIGAYLRIRPSYLVALEQGDLSMTPGRIYALGFLRTYGDYLGFDGHELVRRVKAAIDRPDAPQQAALKAPAYRAPIPPDEGRPAGWLIAMSAVMVLVLYGGWYLFYRGEPAFEQLVQIPGEIGRVTSGVFDLAEDEQPILEPPLVQLVAPLDKTEAPPSRPASIDGSKSNGTEVGAAPAESSPETTFRVGRAALPLAVVDAATQAPTTGAASAVAAEGFSSALAANAGETSPAADATDPIVAEGRVTLLAREPSWIQIRSGSGEYIRTQTLQPGERFAVPARDDLALWTGNAGGLEVLLDEQSLGVLGESGRVIRDVPLAPTQLRAKLSSVR
jgi:cytoskeleton protein RodZ